MQLPTVYTDSPASGSRGGFFRVVRSMLRRGYERIGDEDGQETRDEESIEQQLLSRQYEFSPLRFPRKEIILGVFLLLLGCTLIGFGVLIHVEHWKNDVPGTHTPLCRLFTTLQCILAQSLCA
jgi:hypothetical protein